MLSSSVVAGEKGKMVALLADYDDIKDRIGKVRTAQAAGLGYERGLISILEDCGELSREAHALRNRLRKGNLDDYRKSPERLLATLFPQACNAIQGVLGAEVDYGTFQDKEWLPVGAKFEEAWKVVDEIIQAKRKPSP